MPHIPSLDGFRAISFFFVYFAHLGVKAIPGAFGVTVFFFLSGYLITTLMRVEAERMGMPSLKQFYLRRALRILPPFYIVLLVATSLACIGFLPGTPAFIPVVMQALHLSNYWIAIHGWGGIAEGTGVCWSLAVEEHFYLAFPALFVLLRHMKFTGRQQACVFWGLCVAVMAWRFALVLVLHVSTDRTQLCSDTRIDSILFGCALAMWNNPALDSVEPGVGWALQTDVALFAGLAILVLTFTVRDISFRETGRYTLQGMALTPVFVAAIRRPDRVVFKILNWKPVRFIGTLSYSLYLIHHVALTAVSQHLMLPFPAQAAVALGVAFACAWLMYWIVEAPCARLRKKLTPS